MKHMKKIILLFVSFWAYGQQMHHQMLSSQGGSNLLTSGVLIKQTIGQQSLIGNFRNTSFIVSQGFQQSNKVATAVPEIISISTITYPNPIIDKVNFRFSSTVLGPIKITIFDTMGRLIYSKEKIPIDNLLTIDNLSFSQGEYIVRLSAKNYHYTTNLLK